jgi:hypothetical protein
MMADVNRLVEALGQRYFGKYRGEVVSTDDETHRGRLQVTCAAVLGSEKVWAMPCAPYAGDSVGLFALPPAGTGVWIEFEAGDLGGQAIWSGCFWKDGEIDQSDAVESVMFLKTPGWSIRVDNQGGKVEIEASGGAKITLDSNGVTIDAPKVELTANGGSATVSSSGFDAMSGAFTVT